MSVLLIQLAGPLQSWGDSSRFHRRDTREAPTKSGVVGLIASALGLTRESDISHLAGMEYGVRVDQPGSIVKDFQVERYLPWDERKSKKALPISDRFYLSDAKFIAAVSAEEELLARIDNALRNPVWPLFLGRRSCPPTGSVSLGVHDEFDSVRDALSRAPWMASDWYRGRIERAGQALPNLEVIVDAHRDEPSDFSMDVPLTFSQRHRQYTERATRRYWVTNPDSPQEPPAAPSEDFLPSSN